MPVCVACISNRHHAEHEGAQKWRVYVHGLLLSAAVPSTTRELTDTCLVLETAAPTSLLLSVHFALNKLRKLTNKNSAVSNYFRAEYSPKEHARSLDTPWRQRDCDRTQSVNQRLGAREIILKWNRQETGCQGADRMHLYQSRDQEQTSTDKKMNRIWRFRGGIDIRASRDLRNFRDFTGICSLHHHGFTDRENGGTGSSEVPVPNLTSTKLT